MHSDLTFQTPIAVLSLNPQRLSTPTMKLSLLLTFIFLLPSSFTLALPTTNTKRQLSATSSTDNELSSGSCRTITFIFARGSTETGNMGTTVGPPTCSGLKKQYGDDAVACQGVGGGYTADIGSNVMPDGTSQAGLEEGTKMLKLANSKCPDSKVVAGGYR